MTIKSITDLDLADKRVLIREDFNVPLKDGVIQSDVRLQAALPTIRHAKDAGATVILCSHLGRPTEGEYDDSLSLAPVAEWLSRELGETVTLIKDYVANGFDQSSSTNVVLLENVRFNVGEKKNDEALAKKYAALCDVFVMDAFGTAHRAQASTEGVARFATEACAGLLLSREIEHLEKSLKTPEQPVVAIVGGSKVSTKLTILHSLLDKVDTLIVGGGIANTFLGALGHPVGKSLHEPELFDECHALLAKAKTLGVEIPLPSDVRVATEFSETAHADMLAVELVGDHQLILDIGDDTENAYREQLLNAKTIIWNGPVGVFEFAHFASGTQAVGRAIADSGAFSIAGGGDTIAAIDQFELKGGISYITTGGGAFLEYVEGKTLPAIAVLDK